MKKAPEYLHNHRLRLLIFGGKGGVGKTTMSASAALHLSLINPDKKVLIISTDPAHSISDSFGLTISDQITPIPLKEKNLLGKENLETNLYARELSSENLSEQFKNKNREVIKKIADRGTYFDQEDIADFFSLSLPGMDELMAIIEVADLLSKNIFDILILDTAPTGHTLRMLTLPEQMERWIEVMDLMLQKHRYISSKFTRKQYVKDECDLFLEGLTKDIKNVNKWLKDEESSRFIPVMIPEPMSIYETQKLVAFLQKHHLPLKEIIVNRIVKPADCQFCQTQRSNQLKQIAEIQKSFKDIHLIFVLKLKEEIKGLKDLFLLADYLVAGDITDHLVVKDMTNDLLREDIANHDNYGTIHKNQINNNGSEFDHNSSSKLNFNPHFNPDFHLNPDLEFIVVGGKGGVGKTSVASAISLYLADYHKDKKVLIFSTDPAHSLSDSFDMEIGNQITVISNNLSAIEINADQLFEEFKKSYKKDIETLFSRFLNKGVEIKFDKEVITELLSLAPPGLDEIMAMDTIMNLYEKNAFDIFVIDSSPTGHMLRFLALPGQIREWLKSFFKLLLKYKGTIQLTKAAEKALLMSKNVRRIQETLTNKAKTAFIAVSIPEAMGFLETQRLFESVANADIFCGHLVINMVMPENKCPTCASKRKSQEYYIDKMNYQFSNVEIIQIPQFPYDIHGKTNLEKLLHKIS